MTEPLQSRRYLTRARAKAYDNSTDIKRTTSEKRKAVASTGIDTSDAVPQPAKSARAIKGSSKATEGTLGGHTAPKRKSTRTVAGVAKAGKASATAKPVKKVTFNEDKENRVPTREDHVGEAATRHHHGDDTDELMSSSMGALSVKPRRVPATKLRLPSTGKSALEPLSALSPSKARRPPRILMPREDEEMEDELSYPVIPVKLPAKAKRGIGLSSGRILTEPTGAMDLKKPLDLSASLLTSPARRPPALNIHLPATNSALATTDAPNTVSRPSLTSPARRLPAGAVLGSPTKGGLQALSLKADFPDLSKSSVRSPPKRVKLSRFVAAEGSEDELGMDMESYMLGRSPTRPVKKDFGGIGNGVSKNLGREPENRMIGDVPRLSRPSPAPSMFVDPKSVGIAGAQKKNQNNMGEDVTMDDVDNTRRVMDPMSPTRKRCASPIKGESTNPFFDLSDEEDDLTLHRPCSALSDFKLGRQPNLSPRSVTPEVHGGIPIDPFLLTLDAPDNFLGTIESPSRKFSVPVKMHSIDDAMDINDEENNSLGQPGTSIKPVHSPPTRFTNERGVLAGAVVFVDVYTSEGADASSAFVEALRGLGAKVLKSWNWNPNSTEGDRKVGITHVVFKDGSPRTLQKVKESQGVVLCVGVAWVTACDDEQAWVDEGIYPVDLDHVPRGGHRRRKSMEPKTLAGFSGDAGNFSMPMPPKTPTQQPRKHCFPMTEVGRSMGEVNELALQNLLLARRKSMQFAPKVGSPLRRFAALAIE